jgi:hypothetical protein
MHLLLLLEKMPLVEAVSTDDGRTIKRVNARINHSLSKN